MEQNLKLLREELQQRTKMMELLTEMSYEEVKLAAQDMSQERAKALHELINPNWATVCHLSGKGGIRRAKWTSLLRKMGLIEKRAKAEEIR